MFAPPLRPSILRRESTLELSYHLPHRVYSSKVYPVKSPNGSTIILYGHELGIQVIWRGGRPFKPVQKPVAEKPKSNGTTDNSIMIIDSDDEEQSAETRKASKEKAEFEEEEEELDPAEPFQPILRQIGLDLGAKVLQLSIPHIPSDSSRSPPGSIPPILSTNIVLAAVCSDCTTRIISLPLTPPPPSSEVKSSWGEQIVTISGGFAHQGFANGVSITFTSQPSAAEIDQDGKRLSRSRSRGRPPGANSGLTGSGASDHWNLLLATHSSEASGLLLIYQIPILEQRSGSESVYTLATDHSAPIRREYLSGTASKISFNPSPYPAQRHSHLLVSYSTGAIKVYSCLVPKSTKSPRGRRSSIPGPETAETEGKWLVSLFSAFERSPSGFAQRKRIVDAEWVLGGKAILVLLSNGDWGIWDIEGAGPGANQNVIHGQGSVQGVTGGALTSFAISGSLPLDQVNKSQLSIAGGDTRPKLAPMTPGTRRIREDNLFKGQVVSSSGSNSSFVHGGIAVTDVPDAPRDLRGDEAVLLYYGHQVFSISSLLSLWRNSVKSTGTIEASSRIKPTKLENVNLFGERQIGVDHLSIPSETLIIAEHRLIILASKMSESERMTGLTIRPQVAQQSTVAVDQLKLTRNELDVDGMDRMLDNMANGHRQVNGRQSPAKRRRGFA